MGKFKSMERQKGDSEKRRRQSTTSPWILGSGRTGLRILRTGKAESAGSPNGNTRLAVLP
jgi:hypothetical protein